MILPAINPFLCYSLFKIDMGTTGELLDKWERVLSATLEEESFGQIIEATEGYQKFVYLPLPTL